MKLYVSTVSLTLVSSSRTVKETRTSPCRQRPLHYFPCASGSKELWWTDEENRHAMCSVVAEITVLLTPSKTGQRETVTVSEQSACFVTADFMHNIRRVGGAESLSHSRHQPCWARWSLVTTQMGDRYVLTFASGFAPASRFQRGQLLCRLYESTFARCKSRCPVCLCVPRDHIRALKIP